MLYHISSTASPPSLSMPVAIYCCRTLLSALLFLLVSPFCRCLIVNSNQKFLCQISLFQSTTELITTATTEGTQQINLNDVTDLGDFPKGRSHLHSTASPPLLPVITIGVVCSLRLSVHAQCAAAKFVLPGHLERCGAHGMRVPTLSLARFAEYFLKRDTPTPAGISTHQHSNLPFGAHC